MPSGRILKKSIVTGCWAALLSTLMAASALARPTADVGSPFETFVRLPRAEQIAYLEEIRQALTELDSTASHDPKVAAALREYRGRLSAFLELFSAPEAFAKRRARRHAKAAGAEPEDEGPPPFCINLGFLQDQDDCVPGPRVHDFDTRPVLKKYGLASVSQCSGGSKPCSPFFGFTDQGGLHCSRPDRTASCEKQSPRGDTSFIDAASACSAKAPGSSIAVGSRHIQVSCDALKKFFDDQSALVLRNCAPGKQACQLAHARVAEFRAAAAELAKKKLHESGDLEGTRKMAAYLGLVQNSMSAFGTPTAPRPGQIDKAAGVPCEPGDLVVSAPQAPIAANAPKIIQIPRKAIAPTGAVTGPTGAVAADLPAAPAAGVPVIQGPAAEKPPVRAKVVTHVSPPSAAVAAPGEKPPIVADAHADITPPSAAAAGTSTDRLPSAAAPVARDASDSDLVATNPGEGQPPVASAPVLAVPAPAAEPETQEAETCDPLDIDPRAAQYSPAFWAAEVGGQSFSKDPKVPASRCVEDVDDQDTVVFAKNGNVVVTDAKKNNYSFQANALELVLLKFYAFSIAHPSSGIKIANPLASILPAGTISAVPNAQKDRVFTWTTQDGSVAKIVMHAAGSGMPELSYKPANGAEKTFSGVIPKPEAHQ